MQSTNPIHSPRATSPIQPRANAPKDVRAEIQLILNELPQKAIQRANKLINKLEAISSKCQLKGSAQPTSPELSQFIGCEYYNTTLLVKVDCILKVVRVLLAELSSDNSLQTQDLGIMQQGADNKTHLTSIQNAVAAALHEMIAAQPKVYYGSCDHRDEIRGRWQTIWELLHTDMLISYKQYEKLALMIEAKLHAELFYGFARKVSEIAVLQPLIQGLYKEGLGLQQSSETLLKMRVENSYGSYPNKELMAQKVACVKNDLEAMSNEWNADPELVAILKTRLQLEIINRDAWELRKEEVAMKSHLEISPERREAFFTTLAKFREHAKIKVVDNAPVGQDFYRNVVYAHLMEIRSSCECCVADFTRGTGIELHTILRKLSIERIENIVECSSAKYTEATLRNLMRANKTAHDICEVWLDINMIHDDSALFIYRNIVNAYQALCDACNHKLEVLRSKHLGNIKDASTLQLIDNHKWFEYRKALDLSVVPLVIKFVHETKSRVISGLLEYLDIKPQDVHEISPIIDGLLKAVIAPTQFSAAQKKATATTSVLNIFRQQTRNALKYEQFTKAAYYLEITEAIKRELNPAHCFNIADYQ